LQILRIDEARESRLSELASCWTALSQLVTNVRVREKKPFDQIEGVLALVAQAEAELQSLGGRVCSATPARSPKCVCW